MTKQCRCGHFARAHIGPKTECIGTARIERNALGVKRSVTCPCNQFQASGRTWWQRRITIGTEGQS